MELTLIGHEPVLEFTNILLYFLELFLLHDELISDEGNIISALVLLHHGKHVLQFLTELLVVLRDLDLFLIIVNQLPDALLDQGNTVCHIDVIF